MNARRLNGENSYKKKTTNDVFFSFRIFVAFIITIIIIIKYRGKRSF
jgi:hypothetical protein